MATRMQQRRGTAAQWISTNSGNGPILAPGEIGFESDNNKFKIGDGVNHWVDLTYFTDAQSAIDSLSSLVDGAPDLLNTLNEIAAALGDDPAFFTTVATNLSNHESDTTNVHGIANAADLATQAYVDGAVSGVTTDLTTMAGVGLDYNVVTDQFDIDSTVATKTYADDAVSTHSSDTTSVHGISDTAELATKTFAAELLTNATKSNITITGNKNGLTITAENGVADSTTDNLTEGSTNKYFTDERAQDAVGLSVGAGLTYTDSTGEIKVTPNTYDAHGAATTAEINAKAYADALTTSDIEEGTNKYFTDERAQDAIGNNVGTGLSYDDASGAISVNTTTIQARVVNVSDTEIGYLDGVTSAIQTQIDSKAPTASPTFTGSVSGITKSMVGLGSVDNTSDADKPVSSATQTALDAKLSKSGGTMAGALTLSGAPTSDLHAATKSYVDNVTAGINFHESVHSASIINLAVVYNNGTSGVGATLTANTNRAFATLDGESVVVGQRVLIKDQTDAKQNGIYTLTTVGSSSAPWVLTRATDSDNNPVGELKNGDFCLVINGTVNAGYGYINNSTANPIVIGTDNITYTAFNAGKTVVAGNGLQESTPGIVSIDTAITQTRVSGISDTEIGYLDGVTSGIQGQLDAKLASATAASTYAPIANPTFTGTVAGITKAMVGLGNIDNTSDANKPVSTATQTALDLKAPLASPTFTGNVSGITKSMVGLGNVDNTLDANKPVSTAAQSALDLKAPLSAPTFTGSVVLPSTTAIGNVSATEIEYLDGVTSAIQTQLDAKIAKSLVDAKGDILVGSADNTIDRLAVGANGYLLTADANSTNGIKWAAAPVSLPSQASNSGKYLTTDGTTASWAPVVAAESIHSFAMIG